MKRMLGSPRPKGHKYYLHWMENKNSADKHKEKHNPGLSNHKKWWNDTKVQQGPLKFHQELQQKHIVSETKGSAMQSNENVPSWNMFHQKLSCCTKPNSKKKSSENQQTSGRDWSWQWRWWKLWGPVELRKNQKVETSPANSVCPNTNTQTYLTHIQTYNVCLSFQHGLIKPAECLYSICSLESTQHCSSAVCG